MLTLKDFVGIIAEVSVFVGIIIALIQLYQMKRAQEDNYEIRKKQSTIEFFNKIKDVIDTCDLKKALDIAEPMPVKKINQDENLKNMIIQYLSHIERYAVGINIGVYDITVFDRMAGRYEIRRYKALSKYIEQERNDTGYPYLYWDYTEMVETLKFIRDNIRFPVIDLAIIKKELARREKLKRKYRTGSRS